jgi:GntR family transcriptional regulator
MTRREALLPMLNPNSPVPLYRQLADLILEKVRSGDYPPGFRIPSEHRLAAEYGIGRPTARQATDFLVRKRLLIRRRGSGTFVRDQHQEVDLFSLAGTTSAFHRKGISVTTRLLQEMQLTAIDNDPENPFNGARAYFFSRLTRVEREPVLLEDIYLDTELFAGIERIDLKNRSLAQVVDELYYMRPTGGKQTFRIGYLDGRRARTLDVNPSTPILLVNRFLHFPQAENAVYSELFCRTEHFVFSQTIGGIHDE